MKNNTKFLNLKNIIIFSIFAIVYYQLFYFYHRLSILGGNSFTTSDWLINYNYGFIRRGMFGTILFMFSDSPDVILNILPVVLNLIYIINILLVLRLFLKENQNLISYFILFSPAFLFFPIFDPQGGYRKEILGILTVNILINFKKVILNNNLYLILFHLLFLFSIFSHEVNLLFLPVIFFIFFNEVKFSDKFKKIFVSISSISVLCVISILQTTSESELSQKRNSMCEDLINSGFSDYLCGYGSFDFLAWDTKANYYWSKQSYLDPNQSYEHYLYLFFLSLLPFVLGNFFKKRDLRLFVVISIIFTIPYFIIAIDWGRWIHILIWCYSILYFDMKKTTSNNFSNILFLLVPVYLFLFEIPHCCLNDGNLVFNLTNNFQIFIINLIEFYRV